MTKLLYEKSQTQKADGEDFYCGNGTPEIMNYGGRPRKFPVVIFKRTELYKAYLGHDHYSGADAEHIDNTLLQYASKKFLIRYERTNEDELTNIVEEFIPLVRILKFYPNLTDEQKKRLYNGDVAIQEEKEEIIIIFSPIYIDEIDRKFIVFPEDTNRRLRIAAGDHKKVTTSMHTLMEWCMQNASTKRRSQSINEENLIALLGLEKNKKEGRKKRLMERIEKDIEAIKIMGIIIKAERRANTTGGFKWVFYFNMDYK